MSMETTESIVLQELANIIRDEPLWPGDTLSHATAEICVQRGWVSRNLDGRMGMSSWNIKIDALLERAEVMT